MKMHAHADSETPAAITCSTCIPGSGFPLGMGMASQSLSNFFFTCQRMIRVNARFETCGTPSAMVCKRRRRRC